MTRACCCVVLVFAAPADDRMLLRRRCCPSLARVAPTCRDTVVDVPGDVRCWGYDAYGVTLPPEYDGVPYLQVTSGRSCSCGIKVRTRGCAGVGVVNGR